MSIKATLRWTLCGAASLMSATAAQAQVAPVDTAGADSNRQTDATSDEQTGDVIVTARARRESLQRVPDAITAISGASIEAAGVRTASDLTRLVPNFNFRAGFRSGAAQVTVRGLTTPQGGDLPIALVVDGVQLPGADFFNQNLLDIAQVEVLRGPQGALYGQGALAGAMLITTRAPTDNFEFSGRASYGTGDTYGLTGSLSGPIVNDTLFFRVVGAYRKSDGTIRDVNGRGRNFVDEPYVRAELRLDSGGGFRATLAGNYSKATNGSIFQDRAPARADGTFDIDTDIVRILSNTIGVERRKIYGGSLRMEQDLGGGVLSSTTSYNRLKAVAFGDADFGAANALTQTNIYNVRLVNEDFRYTSASDQPLRYVIGGFFQHRTVDQALSVPFVAGGFAARSADLQKSRSWSLFAQLNYSVTDKFEITGALRYDANNRDRLNQFTGVRLEQDFNKLQPKVSLAYNWSDSFMTYATFAIGYRSGGFNAASSVFAGPVIAGETSRNYEAGFKARLPDRLGSITASAFRIDLEGGQFFFASTTPPSQNTINVDAAHVNGAEIEVQLRPVGKLDLQASVGISDAIIDDFNGTRLNDDTPFPNVPSFTARGSASYEIALGGDFTLTPRVDAYHRGRLYFLPGRTLRSEPYTDTDLRLTLATPRWSIAGFVANLSDERHSEVASSAIRTVSAPRTFGVELGVNFR